MDCKLNEMINRKIILNLNVKLRKWDQNIISSFVCHISRDTGNEINRKKKLVRRDQMNKSENG